MIAAEKARTPVALACRALGVSRSAYYAWAKRGPSARSRADAALGAQIAQIHSESRGRYGTPRVHDALGQRGVRTGRKRVARLMRQQGRVGRARRRFRRTTDSRHDHPIAPNRLQRRFGAAQPNTCWVGDITYLWTAQGWLYLAVVLDLFSRRVIGWSMSERLHSDLALGALEMALGQRRPAKGLLFHSDRGSQYASRPYRERLKSAGITASMSRPGDCLDNAVAESFFSTLKLELAYRTGWATRAQARAEVFEYLELFYNRRRSHSSLGYCTPVEFERRAQAPQGEKVRS